MINISRSPFCLNTFKFVDEFSLVLMGCNSFVLLCLSDVIMADRIRLFQSAQKYQRLMGIYVTESNERAPFNYRNLFCLSCFAQFLVSSFLFFLFQADSFRDYADSFYVTMTSGSTCFYYVVQILQITNFDTLTKEFEDFIERSNLFHSTPFNLTKIFLCEFDFRCEQTAPVLCQTEQEY